VFEIGSSLRDARQRKNLELAEVERATHIRSKYLSALEDERFDALPGPAYAKGFLRTYAEYLGLDGQRFIDEYSTRFPPADEAPGVQLARVRRPRRLLGTRLAVLLVPVAVGLFVWRVASSGGHQHPTFAPPLPHVSASPATPPPKPAKAHPTPPTTARLVLVATRGRCWLLVRLGSANGRPIYERTLEQGQTARFAATRLWIRIGAPWNVDATLNGKRLPLPTKIANVLVTPGRLAPEGRPS
jgi:hypothetical protein